MTAAALDLATPDAPRLADALAEAVASLPLTPADRAAVALATRYAEALDVAAELADLAHLIDPEDEDQARQLAALARAVEAQQVLAELGPKLLAVLAELGATPKARAAGKGAGGGSSDGKPVSPLAKLRAAAKA